MKSENSPDRCHIRGTGRRIDIDGPDPPPRPWSRRSLGREEHGKRPTCPPESASVSPKPAISIAARHETFVSGLDGKVTTDWRRSASSQCRMTKYSRTATGGNIGQRFCTWDSSIISFGRPIHQPSKQHSGTLKTIQVLVEPALRVYIGMFRNCE